MMDQNAPPTSGLFGGMGGAGHAPSQLSPYLNVDPSYLQSSTPEFILNQDTKRGRLENSFTAVGMSYLVGGAVGSAYGIFDGVRNTRKQENMTAKVRNNQIINYVSKAARSSSNSLATLALFYSGTYCLISTKREEDDELKSMASGALTGLLYKSTSGVKNCAAAGAFGLGLAAVWAYGVKRDQRLNDYV